MFIFLVYYMRVQSKLLAVLFSLLFCAVDDALCTCFFNILLES